MTQKIFLYAKKLKQMSKRSIKTSEILIRELIVPRMQQLGITAYQLAKSSGVSESKLSYWINGKQDIGLGLFFEVLYALKLNPLFETKDEEIKQEYTYERFENEGES